MGKIRVTLIVAQAYVFFEYRTDDLTKNAELS